MRLTELALRRAGAADLEEFQRREGLYPSGQEDILTMQRLTPLLLGYERYMVKPGDTYYRIATARGTSVRAMLTANPNQNPNLLIPGQYLNVPYGFPVVPTDVPFSSELLQICVQGLLVRYPFLSQKCIARTAWGRPVTALRIGQGPRCALYNASHHANEWITTPVLLQFLEQYAYAVATEGRILGMDAQQLWRRTTLWLVPMVNPDGVDLVTGAIRPGSQQYQAAQRIAAGFPEIPFPGGWKANLTGTDLNLNYPAGWEQARTNKFALGFTGNMVQANSISVAFKTAFGAPQIAVGVVCALIAAFIFLGGVGRIASVTEKVVPIMALFYMAGCVVILCFNHAAIIPAFKAIFVAAFDPQAILGGAAGITIQKAMRYGVARGLFSNEAGMGSTPHAHALAKVKRPQDQGEIAIVSVFIDTFVVLTLTAMVILTSGMLNPGAPDGLQGTELAQAAFTASLGTLGGAFVAICMLFFAFSTIIGWYFFGEQNVKALFGHKAVKAYATIVVICIVIGSALHVDLVWNLSDLFNGLMVFPNLIALLALSGLVAKAARDEDI